MPYWHARHELRIKKLQYIKLVEASYKTVERMYRHVIPKETFAPKLRKSEICIKSQNLIMRDFTVNVFD